MILSALALLSVAGTAPPVQEDAAHRADRLRTEQLNHDVLDGVEQRQANDRSQQRAWRAKQDAYEKAAAAWRKREAERQRYNAALR